MLIAGLLAAIPARAALPMFADVGAGLLGVSDSCAAWGDYDADGDLDLLVAGNTGTSGVVARLYRNDGTGFSEETHAVLPGVSLGSVAWGDYDHDGDLDILLCGQSPTLGPLSRIYRNDDGGVFTWVSSTGLPGVSNGNATWADFDGDGDLDVLLTGSLVNLTKIARLYRNDGGGVFTEVAAVALPGVVNGIGAWGDYDGDGDPDLLLTGSIGASRIARIYRNDGGGVFAQETQAVLLGVANGGAAWGDYDGDGDLDILLFGNMGSGLISWLYRNDGGGVFTRDTHATFPGDSFGSVDWGDYDNDGALDVLMTGESDAGKIARLYHNDGGGVFTLDVGVVLPGVAKGGATWGDYDGDGDLDFALLGNTGLQRIAQVWNNSLVMETNQQPVADAGGPYEVECAGAGTWVQLDGTGSSDPDGDSLLYQWFVDLPGASFDDSTSAEPILTFTGTQNMSFEVKLAVLDADFVSVATATVTALDRVPPTILCPDNIVELPESPDGNIVTYAPLAADVCDPYPTVVATPPSGSLFAPGTTTAVAVSASDAAGNVSHATFTVKILSADEVLKQLRAKVEDLGARRRLNRCETQGLLVILRCTAESMARGHTRVAEAQVRGFIEIVNHWIRRGRLSLAEGQPLLDLARSLIAVLEPPTRPANHGRDNDRDGRSGR